MTNHPSLPNLVPSTRASTYYVGKMGNLLPRAATLPARIGFGIWGCWMHLYSMIRSRFNILKYFLRSWNVILNATWIKDAHPHRIKYRLVQQAD